jgi:glycosyltransferase involved in cell wall biosynthesis
MSKPVVLTFVDYYLPGCKGGGPMRTIVNMVQQLAECFSFRIVTRDRDLGDTAPYPDCLCETWLPVGEAQVMYLPPQRFTFGTLRRIISQTEHDVLYLNSLFSPTFTIRPLMLRQLGLIQRSPVIVAPRGELFPGALRLHWPKKAAYLLAVTLTHLYGGVLWHASSAQEKERILAWFGRKADVCIAPNLCSAPKEIHPALRGRTKHPGRLRIACVARISRNKNLVGALQFLSGLHGQVEFHVYGPKEDAAYWAECRQEIDKLPANVTVKVHGTVAHDQVTSTLWQHHLVLLPTHGENFGHSILEGLLAGCLLLISDRTPWRGLETKRVGWDLPLDRPEEFRRVLQQCVDMDDEEFQTMSCRAREFGLSVTADQEVLTRNVRLFQVATGLKRSAA